MKKLYTKKDIDEAYHRGFLDGKMSDPRVARRWKIYALRDEGYSMYEIQKIMGVKYINSIFEVLKNRHKHENTSPATPIISKINKLSV